MAVSFTVAGAAAASLAYAGPAIASPQGHVGRLNRAALARPASPGITPTGKSTAYAGYFLGNEFPTGGGPLTTTIKVPHIKSCAHPLRAVVPGVGTDVFGPSTNSFDLAGVFVGCVNGSATYYPVLVLNGHETDYRTAKVKPGDTVVLTINATTSSTTVSATDKTHSSASKKRTGAGAEGYGGPAAFDWPWFNGAGPAVVGVPDFGTVHFSATKFEGQAFNSSTYSSELVRLDRYKNYNPSTHTYTTLQIATGPFKSDNESFNSVYHHS